MGSGNGKNSGGTQVVVDLPEVTLAQLDALADAKNMSRTDALIAAVSTAKQLVDAESAGAKVIVRKAG